MLWLSSSALVMQLETLLRGKEEELARSEAALKRELSISETENRFSHQPQQFAVGMQPPHAQGTYQAIPGSGRTGSMHGVQPVEYGAGSPTLTKKDCPVGFALSRWAAKCLRDSMIVQVRENLPAYLWRGRWQWVVAITATTACPHTMLKWQGHQCTWRNL